MREHRITCWACAIMPDHAHFIFRRHERSVERIAIGLKAYATRALLDAGLHPFQSITPVPKIWARDSRHVFLFDDADIRSRIRYVDRNPTNAGLKSQRWSFIQSFAAVFA